MAKRVKQLPGVELVEYDPEDPDTFPSVCQLSEEVHDRFGFTGGEVLVFTPYGAYIGKLSHLLYDPFKETHP